MKEEGGEGACAPASYVKYADYAARGVVVVAGEGRHAVSVPRATNENASGARARAIFAVAFFVSGRNRAAS